MPHIEYKSKERVTNMKPIKTELLRKLIVLSLVVMLPSVVPAEGIPSTEIVIAAREGLKTFLNEVNAQNLDRFGFYSQGDITGAELGAAFQVFTIPPDKILSYDPSISDLTSMIVPTNLWQFLIISQGNPKSLLTVDFLNDQWTAVSIGASGLAMQLSKITEAWPASAGYRWRLIKVYQAKSDLLEISLGDKVIGIVPLLSARMALGFEKEDFDPLGLEDSRNILIYLKPTVENNLQEEK
jgi:hypothetical protein